SSLESYMIMRYHHFLILSIHHTEITEIYTLSLHDALPILASILGLNVNLSAPQHTANDKTKMAAIIINMITSIINIESNCFSMINRKSTRLNSSHRTISYAVFCLKKKKSFHLPSTIYFTIH